jgi:hypothetical protein
MDRDPLDRIADSYKTIADTQQLLVQAALQNAETNRRIDDTQRLGRCVQAFAIGLLGLSLLGTAIVGWQLWVHRHDSDAIHQAILNNEQVIEAHTKALLEQLRQR